MRVWGGSAVCSQPSPRIAPPPPLSSAIPTPVCSWRMMIEQWLAVFRDCLTCSLGAAPCLIFCSRVDLVFGSIPWEFYAGLRGFLLNIFHESAGVELSSWRSMFRFRVLFSGFAAAMSPGLRRGRGGGREALSQISAIDSAGLFLCLVPE